MLYEQQPSAFHTGIGATFNILYMNPDTAYW